MSKGQSAMSRLFGSWGRGAKPVLLAAIAMVALLASVGTASAAHTHVFDEEFEPSGCPEIFEMNADFTHDWLYVTCVLGTEHRVVKRYTTQGAPAPFSADAEEPYLEGNTILYNPAGANGEGKIGSNFYLETAVDNSGGINNGDLFLGGPASGTLAGTMSIFEPSGKLKTAKIFSLFPPDAIAVDPNGNIYALNGGNAGYIRKFNPFLHEIGTICESRQKAFAKADSHEGLWATSAFLGLHNENLQKFEPEAFSTHTGQVDNGGCVNNQAELEELGMPFPAPTSPFVPPLHTGNFTTFEVDPTNDDVLIDHKTGSGREIWTFSRGTAEEPSHRDAPPFGAGDIGEATLGFMTADDLGNVYVATNGNRIAKFKLGSIVPDIRTPKVATEDIGHEEAIVRAHLETAGGPPITECKVLWGKTEEEAEEEVNAPLPCSPDPSGAPFASNTDVSAELTGLTTNVKYHFYFVAVNENGYNQGVTREVIPVAVLNVNTEAASQVGQHEATLNGSFDPDNIPTEYWFEYGLNTQYGSSTPVVGGVSGSGSQSVSALISEIPAGRRFHYRIVARNSLGTTRGGDATFRTSAAPEISAVRATELTGATATLNAHIDPVGEPTTYEFVYGQTPAYGNSVPVGGASLASATEAEDVSQVISGLQPGLTYHFAVVARNAEGTTQSPDNTFDFEPPLCPNAHVRQQTHASYLPDCRAYELVSPSDAGSVLMFPSDSIGEFSFKEGRQAGKIWPVNNGLATNPPRFEYFAGLGTVGNLDAPNFFFDEYVTTRTATGWVTTLPGLKGREALLPARMRCADSLAVCIDHNEGELEGPPVQIAANLFDVSGERLGTLPTNVGAIPNAEYEHGDQFGEEQLSGDGNHYVFSSLTHVYAPGGSTVTPGSVYDNDIAAKKVTLVSLTPANEPIPSELNDPEEYLELPGVSTDGSHILMAVGSGEGGSHLYMRVDDSVTYDVSEGTGVQLLGMTRDGSKVDFISPNRLSPEDTDNSADLYQWSENNGNPTLKVLSQGNGQGDTDECLPVGFGSQCDAVQLQTERGHRFGLISSPTMDSLLASKSGDAFFFSPENLDPQHPGVLNQKNLYEYHAGAPHYVATFDPGTKVNRIQISPDGLHAGILTASDLTGYDSHGKREMYTYDVETGNIQCASCRPDGLPPIANVTASEGGPFMADDGRVFFNTRDPLVPRDVDGELTDVYEFVNGRAQLISSGTASRDSTGGAKVANALQLPKNAITGLESVSADGRDVYFSTYDTLVPQDENGSFVKFYDARSNGGFEPEPKFAGCEAADECHGEGAPAAAPPVIGTGASTGVTGQVIPKAKKAKHHRHKRHAGKKHRKRQRSGHKGAGRRG